MLATRRANAEVQHTHTHTQAGRQQEAGDWGHQDAGPSLCDMCENALCCHLTLWPFGPLTVADGHCLGVPPTVESKSILHSTSGCPLQWNLFIFALVLLAQDWSGLDWAGLKLCRWQRECMAMSPTKDYWIASQPDRRTATQTDRQTESQSQLAAGKMEIGKMLCFTFNLKCKHINTSLFAARALPTCGRRLTNSFRMLYGLHAALH